MKIVALINSAARSVPADGEERMRHALQSIGIGDADIVALDVIGVEVQLRQLAASRPDFLIVWGGDGTHRAALSTIGRQSANLVLLPGGTMNLLSKSLHGDTSWARILRRVLAKPMKKLLPAGRVNDKLFYCAMLAGAPVQFAEARESFRHGDIGATATHVGAGFDALQNMHLRAHYGDGHSFTDHTLPTTSVIGALVGPMSRTGRMEIVSLEHPSAFSALDALWAFCISSWRDTTGVNIVSAETLVIESGSREIVPIMLDGEEMVAGSAVSVTYLSAAAECFVAHRASIGSSGAGQCS